MRVLFSRQIKKFKIHKSELKNINYSLQNHLNQQIAIAMNGQNHKKVAQVVIELVQELCLLM